MAKSYTLGEGAILQLTSMKEALQGTYHKGAVLPNEDQAQFTEHYPESRFQLETFGGPTGMEWLMTGSPCQCERESGAGVRSGVAASGYIAGHVWLYDSSIISGGLKANVLEVSGITIPGNTTHHIYCDVLYSGFNSGLFAEIKYSASGFPIMRVVSGFNSWTRFPLGRVVNSGGNTYAEEWCQSDIVFPPSTGSAISPVKLVSKVNDSTYSGNVFGNGTAATATEVGVLIRVEDIAAGETLRFGIRFSAAKMVSGGVSQWTLIEVPRFV